MRQAPPPLAVFAARRGRFAGATASAAAAVRRASLTTTVAETSNAAIGSTSVAVARHEEQPVNAPAVPAAGAVLRRTSLPTAEASSVRIDRESKVQRREQQPVSLRVDSSRDQQRHHDEVVNDEEDLEEEKEDETMESGDVHEGSTATEEDETVNDANVEGNVDARVENDEEAHEDNNNANEVIIADNDIANESKNDDDEAISEVNDEVAHVTHSNVANEVNKRVDVMIEEQDNNEEREADDRNDDEEESNSDDDVTDEYNEATDDAMDNGGARSGPSGGGNGNNDNVTGITTTISGTTMVSESFPTRFASWEELEDYIEELGATTFQLFHKRSSLSVGHRHAMVENSKLKKGKAIDKVNDPDFIPFEWVAYNRVYSCTCGFRNLRRGQGIRNHVVVRGTGCKVKITAAVTYDRDTGVYFLKTKLKGVHNHPCDRERYYSYAENRRFESALLLEMAAMDARGCKAREILDHASTYMWNKTGMKPLYKMSDVRNALRRHRKHAAAAAYANNEENLPSQRTESETKAARDQRGAQQEQEQERGAAAHRTMPGESPDSEVESGSATDQRSENLSWMTAAAGSRTENNNSSGGERQQRNQRKRRADAITGEAAATTQSEAFEPFAVARGLQKVTLSQLKVLMDSPYSYALAHEDIERVVLASPQRAIQTISGFTCEVFVLPPDFKPDDLEFVLPRHAVAGCEEAIIDACRTRKLLPPALGVKLTVQLPYAETQMAVHVTSRQLWTMKKIHLARQHVLDAKKALSWINAPNLLPSARPVAPFDDVFDYTKENLARTLRFLPLTTTVVRGTVTDPLAPPFGFTDTVSGASIAKFASVGNLDLECMKAVLLHMHSRFHAEAAMVCPSFMLELSSSADPTVRFRKASAYGAFTTRKLCVMGVTQLRSKRWASFFFDCARNKCILFQSVEEEFVEHREKVGDLLAGFELKDTTFACSAIPTPVSANDSGVLALLFLELFVLKKTWATIPYTNLAYFRVRYMMQCIQVVNCQDVHEIRAL